MASFRSRIYRHVSISITLAAVVTIIGVAGGIEADNCPDAWITAKVKTKLMADDGIGAFKVNVDTDECVVTLNGCVDTRGGIKNAGKIARSIKKVKSVNNRLAVCPKD